MPSRKKRKRDRRRAEATAEAPVLRGGWGRGSEIRPADLLLIRQSVREGWDIPFAQAKSLINDVVVSASKATDKPRLQIAAVRVVIDVVKAEQGGFDYLQRRRAKR
jgi:hypothetical protein